MGCGLVGGVVVGCATPRAPLSNVPAAASAPPRSSFVEPRWRGGFERGDLSGWSYLLNARGLSVVAAPVAEGRWAGRIEIGPDELWPNGLNRVELQHKPPPAALAEGARSCFAWRFFLPVPLSGSRHQIGYWESYPSYRQIMSFEVRGEDLAFVTRLPDDRTHWHGAGQATAGVWHRIGMCARWSADPARGTVDVWFDGRPVVTRAAARTLWDAPNLIQLGLLRDEPEAPEIMFLDDAREGATPESVGVPVEAAAPAPAARASSGW